MTVILPPGIQAKNAEPAKLGKCCRAFIQVMAGNGGENETASNSLQFATWMLALAATLSAAGVLGTLTFAFSTGRAITKIETRQEDFLNRISVAMQDTQELKQEISRQKNQIDRVFRMAESTREALRITGIIKGLQ